MDRRASLGRSPLRSQILTSHRQKQAADSATASPHLQHLQEVAAWASSAVPALGAFLGSRLASTCESLGCPPPPSPHFTCERCESILQVGTNCSVRVRNRKLKKLSTKAKGVAASNNSIVYFCHYCSFENVKSGTRKAYVKIKPTEVAARNKLSELSQGLDVSMPERVPQVNKMLNNELRFSYNGFSTESPGSTGKKTKRKGWLSLKELAASSTGLPSSGDRTILNLKPTKSPHLSQKKLSDSSRAMAIVSQNDSETVASTSSIEGKPSEQANRIKSGLELEQCNALGITVDADDTGLQRKLSLDQSEAGLTWSEQSTALTTYLGCTAGDTLLESGTSLNNEDKAHDSMVIVSQFYSQKDTRAGQDTPSETNQTGHETLSYVSQTSECRTSPGNHGHNPNVLLAPGLNGHEDHIEVAHTSHNNKIPDLAIYEGQDHAKVAPSFGYSAISAETMPPISSIVGPKKLNADEVKCSVRISEKLYANEVKGKGMKLNVDEVKDMGLMPETLHVDEMKDMAMKLNVHEVKDMCMIREMLNGDKLKGVTMKVNAHEAKVTGMILERLNADEMIDTGMISETLNADEVKDTFLIPETLNANERKDTGMISKRLNDDDVKDTGTIPEEVKKAGGIEEEKLNADDLKDTGMIPEMMNAGEVKDLGIMPKKSIAEEMHDKRIICTLPLQGKVELVNAFRSETVFAEAPDLKEAHRDAVLVPAIAGTEAAGLDATGIICTGTLQNREEDANIHVSQTFIIHAPVSEETPRAEKRKSDAAVNLQPPIQDGDSEVHISNQNLDGGQDAAICPLPSEMLTQDNRPSVVGVKCSLSLEEETLQILKQTLDKVNDTIVAQQKHADLLKELKKTVRKEKLLRLQQQKSSAASYYSIKQELSVIPSLRNEIHYLSNQVVEAMKVVNQLTERLAEATTPKQGADASTVAVMEDDSGHFNVENLNTSRLLADEEVKALPSKKRRLTIIDVSAGTTSKQQKGSKSEASRSEVNGLHCEVHVRQEKETRSTRPADVLSDACETTKDWTLAFERKVKSRSKKKPMLTRVGRHWFAVRKTNRKLKWRVV